MMKWYGVRIATTSGKRRTYWLSALQTMAKTARTAARSSIFQKIRNITCHSDTSACFFLLIMPFVIKLSGREESIW